MCVLLGGMGVCVRGRLFFLALTCPVLFCPVLSCPVPPPSSTYQGCYGIEAVPEGEWLCWPCVDYEASLRRQGQSQATIRPPRCVHAGGVLLVLFVLL